MSMTVKRRKDVRLPKYFQHKLADIRGGVSVKTSELGGDIILEGAVLSAPDNGICHVVKIARLAVAADATDTELLVGKYHNFNVGDIVMTKVGGAAVAITKIAAGKSTDTITISAALGALAEGACLIEAAEATEAAKEATEEDEATDGAQFKYAPFALNGTSGQFVADSNFVTDAQLIGVIANLTYPEEVKTALNGIVFL